MSAIKLKFGKVACTTKNVAQHMITRGVDELEQLTLDKPAPSWRRKFHPKIRHKKKNEWKWGAKVPCESLNEKDTEWKTIRQDFNGNFEQSLQCPSPWESWWCWGMGKEKEAVLRAFCILLLTFGGQMPCFSRGVCSLVFPILNYCVLFPHGKKLHPSPFGRTWIISCWWLLETPYEFLTFHVRAAMVTQFTV